MAKKNNNIEAFFRDFIGGGILRIVVFTAAGISLFFAVPWLLIKIVEIIGSILLG